MRHGTKIFISYRREDAEGHAGRLYADLTRAGRFPREQVFLDVKSVGPGEDFVRGVEAALDSCEALLAVIGPKWLDVSDAGGARRLDAADDLVRRELVRAMERGARVIPVLVQGASMPREPLLPDDLKPLARLQAVEVRHTRWEDDVEELVRILKVRLKRRRRRAAVVASGLALVFMSLLPISFARGPLPLGPDAVPPVPYDKQPDRQQDLILKGPFEFDGAPSRPLLFYSGRPIADMSVEFDSARYLSETDQTDEPNPKRQEGWEEVSHNTLEGEGEARRDFTRPCFTSAALTLAKGEGPLNELRFFQQSVPPGEGPDQYRDLDLRADTRLIVKLITSPTTDAALQEGPGCWKRLGFGKEEPLDYVGGRDLDIIAREQSDVRFHFVPLRDEQTPLTAPSFLDIKAGDFIEPFAFNPRTPFRVREVQIVPRHGGDAVFAARSADDGQPLRVSALKVGAAELRVELEGLAQVTGKREDFLAALLTRAKVFRFRAGLWLAATLALLLFFAWAVRPFISKSRDR